MESTTYFEDNREHPYTDRGSSPQLLSDFIGWLSGKSEELEELHLALYLFNNDHFFEQLLAAVPKTAKSTIYSIPLEGYDCDNLHSITDYETGMAISSGTKHDFAESLYDKIKAGSYQSIELRIVPHMYLRSHRVKAFSRGQLPYSLHCKCFYAKCRNGESFAGIASTNFAVRDEGKMELLSIISLSKGMDRNAGDFFKGLYENSFPVQSFNANANWTRYPVKTRPVPPKSCLMFVAPFYENSASDFEENLRTMVNRAKRRIIVCAQHISSYKYGFDKRYAEPPSDGWAQRDGFLKDVLEKAHNGVKTVLISQTYTDEAGSHGCREPQNKAAFIEFAEAAKAAGCRYYVNDRVHCKFLIIDDIAVVTTSNLTPTQFIYLPNVDIKEFDNMPGASYSGIFCEVGAYYAAEDPNMVKKLEDIAQTILDDSATKKMIAPPQKQARS